MGAGAGQTMTVIQTIQQAMTEVGLPKPTSVISNTEVTVQQFLALLNRCGNEMVVGYPWEQLVKTWTVPVVAGQASYSLPDDWNYFIDQTQWDQTNHWPLLGPKSAQEWQQLKSGVISSGPRMRYRIVGARFEIFPTPGTPPPVITMEYVTVNWLMDSGNPTLLYYAPAHDSDVILLDPWVVVAFLKMKFKEEKGLDTTAAQKDFSVAWSSRIGKDKGAPILSLSPDLGSPFVGIHSVPDGNWGL